VLAIDLIDDLAVSGNYSGKTSLQLFVERLVQRFHTDLSCYRLSTTCELKIISDVAYDRSLRAFRLNKLLANGGE
jgi:hypothetical protein